MLKESKLLAFNIHNYVKLHFPTFSINFLIFDIQHIKKVIAKPTKLDSQSMDDTVVITYIEIA